MLLLGVSSRVQPGGSGKLQTALICLLLATSTLAVYSPATRFAFVSYDDPDYVSENANIARGLNAQSLVWAFQTGHAANWHPVTWLSHALDCSLYGLNPAGHHLTSLLFHAANALLLFVVLQQMTGARWRSAFVAALFALHPLHVESVAWVSERKDVLSTFFGLLAIWAYAEYVRASAAATRAGPGRRGSSWCLYALSLGLFALSLMSKPMLVTLPFVLLLLDYWPLGRIPASARWVHLSGLLREKLPFLALAMTSCIVTFLVQRAGAAVVPLEHYPFPMRLTGAVMGYWGYLQNLVWPHGLNFLYLPHPWPAQQVALAAVMLAAVTALIVGLARKFPFACVGWFWYLGTLVPVIGLVQVGNQRMADRYTYIPLVGCFIILSWGGYAVLRAWAVPKATIAGVAGLTVAGCIWSTTLQLSHWRNSTALFEQAIRCDAGNFVAHTFLGNLLVGQKRFEEADAHYAEALHIRPDHADAYVGRGFALAQQGKPDEAITSYQMALQLKPDQAGAHKNLGSVLAERGQTDGAIKQFSEAVRLDPADAAAQYDLGTALLSRGDFAAAAGALSRSLQLRPDDLETRQNLALALVRQGRLLEAVPLLIQVVDQHPDAQSHYKLAEALLLLGRTGEAATHFRAALALEPDLVPALNNLAWILATHPDSQLRNGAEAVRLAGHACELNGGSDGSLLATLAAAYAEAGRFDDAVATARKVRDLALAAGDRRAVGVAEERVAQYQAGTPLRQQP